MAKQRKMFYYYLNQLCILKGFLLLFHELRSNVLFWIKFI